MIGGRKPANQPRKMTIDFLVNFCVEYLYCYVRWYASLQPPTICAKSSGAYNA
jgi:hypothetical protein